MKRIIEEEIKKWEVKRLPDAPLDMITFQEIVQILPEEISFKIDVFMVGKEARIGAVAGDLHLAFDYEGCPIPSEVTKFFADIFNKFPIKLHFFRNWKFFIPALCQIYQDGKLIITKDTLTYIRVPKSFYTFQKPLKVDEFKAKLPNKIPFPIDIWLTGGLVKFGQTYHDIDLIIFDKEDFNKYYSEIMSYFKQIYKRGIDVFAGYKTVRGEGAAPIFKLYSKGILGG